MMTTTVRQGLSDRYEAIARQYPESTSWSERLDAVRRGDILVEPGWMLRPIVGEDVDVFGVYRVYPDDRVERDRYLERLEHDRFFGGAAP